MKVLLYEFTIGCAVVPLIVDYEEFEQHYKNAVEHAVSSL